MADKTPAKFNIPEGHRPEEFLTDEDLAAYHAHRLAAAKPSDPDFAELQRVAHHHARAAALTAAAVEEAHASAEAALAAK